LKSLRRFPPAARRSIRSAVALAKFAFFTDGPLDVDGDRQWRRVAVYLNAPFNELGPYGNRNRNDAASMLSMAFNKIRFAFLES
jgi:hypothetical protein